MYYEYLIAENEPPQSKGRYYVEAGRRILHLVQHFGTRQII